MSFCFFYFLKKTIILQNLKIKRGRSLTISENIVMRLRRHLKRNKQQQQQQQQLKREGSHGWSRASVTTCCEAFAHPAASPPERLANILPPSAWRRGEGKAEKRRRRSSIKWRKRMRGEEEEEEERRRMVVSQSLRSLRNLVDYDQFPRYRRPRRP